MSISRDRLRWNGWGPLGHSYSLSRGREAAVLAELGRRFARDLSALHEPVPFDSLEIPPSRLGEGVLANLRAACGQDGVRLSAHERVTHACGRSLPDLLRLRCGELRQLPDAVVVPPDEGAVAAVLRVASDAGVAVVPFGGGTSVVGGVDPPCDDAWRAALALDTTALDALLRLDPESGTATFQAGIDGPALEAALSARGFTLGHFPQSFEQSTLGGWIATRATGHFSARYGGIERLLVAVRVVTPSGVLRTLEVPRSAAGPDLKQLILGSEGTLGVIVEATLRVRPKPMREEERGALVPGFAAGVAVARELVQGDVPVSMLRLSDGPETELFQVLRRDPERRIDPTAWVLAAARRLGLGEGRAAFVYGTAGSRRTARETLRAVRRSVRRHGGLPLGRAPGRSWRRDRFRTPYLRDWLLDHDVAVDTLETAVPWSRLEAAHERILRALRGTLDVHAGAGLAMAHLSHAYRDGASLYFTILYPLDASQALKQWDGIKADATEAVLAACGTVSHHHGIGADHARWIATEKGAIALAALRAARDAVDPAGVMNPGKWL